MHVAGLGFDMKNKGLKTCEVDLTTKYNDWRV